MRKKKRTSLEKRVKKSGRKASKPKRGNVTARKARPKGALEVFVDGSNVIRSSPKPTLKNLKLVLQELNKKKYRPIVFVDASERHVLGGKASEKERKALERMIKRGDVQQVPAHTSADRWVLKYASGRPGCKVLSNDLFQGYEEKFPLVRDEGRFIRFMVVEGRAMLEERTPVEEPEVLDKGGAGEGGMSNEEYQRYFLREGVRRIGMIGYRDVEITSGMDGVGYVKAKARHILGHPLLKGLIDIEKTFPVTGRLEDGKLSRGVEIILRRREHPEGGEPTTDHEVVVDELRKFIKTTSLVNLVIYVDTGVTYLDDGIRVDGWGFGALESKEGRQLWTVGGHCGGPDETRYWISSELCGVSKGLLRKSLKYRARVTVHDLDEEEIEKMMEGLAGAKREFDRELEACRWLLGKISELEDELRSK